MNRIMQGKARQRLPRQEMDAGAQMVVLSRPVMGKTTATSNEHIKYMYCFR